MASTKHSRPDIISNSFTTIFNITKRIIRPFHLGSNNLATTWSQSFVACKCGGSQTSTIYYNIVVCPQLQVVQCKILKSLLG